MKETADRRITAIKAGVIAGCFCMIFVCLGFCSSNKGLYLAAITDALGIKRTLFSINDSCRYIATAAVNLFFGSLVKKFGAKKLVGAGFACLIASVLIYANASHVAVFYIGGCFLGIGLAWTTTTMVSYLVNRWFQKNRGTISGFVLCANGLGGALAAQIVTPIIYEQGNPFGYKNAYNLVALLLLVTGIVAVLLIREPSGATAFVPGKKKNRKESWSGIRFAEALRRPYFYAAAACVFLTGMSLQAINGIAPAHLGDIGMDPGYIATALSMHSIALCGSKFLAGFSYDKLGLRITLILCQLCGLFSFLALILSGVGDFAVTGTLAWAILSAMALPLETVLIQFICAELFGEQDFSKMLGVFVSINTAGFAFSTPIANLAYDTFGTYDPMLYGVAGIILVILFSYHFIISAAEKTRMYVQQSTKDAGRNAE